MAKNRLEWLLTEQACNAYSFVSVALYETYGQDNIEYAIDHADLGTVVCTGDKLEMILSLDTKCLKTVIVMDGDASEEALAMSEKKGIKLLPFSEVESMGKKSPLEPVGPKPEDVATIMYTSGTTGRPKGVVHTHRSMVAGFAGLMSYYSDLPPSKIYEVYLSYLPLAHILERIATVAMIYLGAAIAFSDAKTLSKDLKAVRPTVLTGVPRVFERIKKGIYTNLNRGFFLKVRHFSENSTKIFLPSNISHIKKFPPIFLTNSRKNSSTWHSPPKNRSFPAPVHSKPKLRLGTPSGCSTSSKPNSVAAFDSS
jgi:long-chain acyl-CoA synthetase